jgi:hypothetical protein
MFGANFKTQKTVFFLVLESAVWHFNIQRPMVVKANDLGDLLSFFQYT